jgi:hypothetical protein
MSAPCTTTCDRAEEAQRILGELSILVDLIRLQLNLIVTGGSEVTLPVAIG